MRIVIAGDSAVVRTGLAEILADSGHEVVAAVGNADDLLAAVDEHHPDAAVVDVRMPPGYTDEGLRAAIAIRRDHPKTGVLVFSQYIETRYAADLLGSGSGAAGVGYLLKDRVADVEEFVEALSRMAAGGTALDPEVVTQFLGASRRNDRLAALTVRERDVLALMAEGPLQCRDRRDLSGFRAVRREARREHLQQTRPSPVGRRPPPGARCPPLLGVLTGHIADTNRKNPLAPARLRAPAPSGMVARPNPNCS
jgi:DNA-binding NarL/FixJ family response regulator